MRRQISEQRNLLLGCRLGCRTPAESGGLPAPAFKSSGWTKVSGRWQLADRSRFGLAMLAALAHVNAQAN